MVNTIGYKSANKVFEVDESTIPSMMFIQGRQVLLLGECLVIFQQRGQPIIIFA